MSVALYIVLESQVPGFDHQVNGKALGRLGELLDVRADKVGTKPLMAFFGAFLEEVGIECLVGHPAEIRAAEPRKQKHDRRDAGLRLVNWQWRLS